MEKDYETFIFVVFSGTIKAQQHNDNNSTANFSPPFI